MQSFTKFEHWNVGCTGTLASWLNAHQFILVKLWVNKYWKKFEKEGRKRKMWLLWIYRLHSKVLWIIRWGFWFLVEVLLYRFEIWIPTHKGLNHGVDVTDVNCRGLAYNQLALGFLKQNNRLWVNEYWSNNVLMGKRSFTMVRNKRSTSPLEVLSWRLTHPTLMVNEDWGYNDSYT